MIFLKNIAADYHLEQLYIPFSGARIMIYCEEEEEMQCQRWPGFAYIKGCRFLVSPTLVSLLPTNKFPWTTSLRCGASYTLPSYIHLPAYDSPIVNRHMHPTACSYSKPSMVITETRAFNLRCPNIHLLSVVATASMSSLSSHDHLTFPLKKHFLLQT